MLLPLRELVGVASNSFLWQLGVFDYTSVVAPILELGMYKVRNTQVPFPLIPSSRLPLLPLLLMAYGSALLASL